MGMGIDSIARFAEELLATNLWVRILGSFFLLFLNGVFWATVFQFYFPSLLGDAAFASTFRDLSLIVGTVYGYFASSQAEGYTTSMRMYRTLIRKVKTANLGLVGLYNSLEPTLREDVTLHVTRLKVAYQFVSFYSYRLFAPRNKDELGEGQYFPDIRYMEVFDENLASATEATKKIYDIEGIPQELVEIKARELMDGARSSARTKSPEELTLAFLDALHAYIMRELSHLHRRGINDVLLDVSTRPIEQVWSTLENIEIVRDIQEPAIFNVHYGFILFFFFLVWIPIQMWTLLGYTPAVVLYPFVAYTFLAVAVYRQWIGNPFAPDRPTMLAPVLTWRHAAIRDIEIGFRSDPPPDAYPIDEEKRRGT